MFKVKLHSLRLVGGHNIHGSVYLDFGDSQFPFSNWQDFVVVILDAWLTAAKQIRDDGKQIATVYFMEGPYHVQVDIVPNSSDCMVICKKSMGLNNDVVQQQVQCGLNELIDDLLEISKSVLSVCRENNWSMRDVKLFEQHLQYFTNE